MFMRSSLHRLGQAKLEAVRCVDQRVAIRHGENVVDPTNAKQIDDAVRPPWRRRCPSRPP
jgi:hypothetical protein